jgi:predicted RNA-binding Zn ribbon-like protein
MQNLPNQATAILAQYVPDQGTTLRQTAGPTPAQTAATLAERVFARVAQQKPHLIDEFRADPEIYRRPLASALAQALTADTDFAAEVQVLVQQYHQAVTNVAGAGGVAAQEINAPVATQGSTAAGGDITITGDGNVVGNESSSRVRKGGITAERIEADNVVDGVQLQGGTPEMAANLVQAAKAIQRGGITAKEIKAGNVVSGLQFLTGKPPETQAELRAEVAALREQVQQALTAQEIADAGDAEDVEEALATAEAELEKPEPNGKRAARKLKEVAEILTGAAETATAAGKVGRAVVKLAPVAMMVWKMAETLF